MVKGGGVYRQVQLYCGEREEQLALRKGLSMSEFLDKVKQFVINRAIRNLSQLNTPEARKVINNYYEGEERIRKREAE